MTKTPTRLNNVGKSPDQQKREDRNAELRVLAVTKMQQLLKVLSDPKFCGSLAMEIHAKHGQLRSVKTQFTEFNESL